MKLKITICFGLVAPSFVALAADDNRPNIQ